MIEPIHHLEPRQLTGTEPEYSKLRDEALLWRAITLAVESGLTYGTDLPVGAVAAQGNVISGRHYASDKRYGSNYDFAHAEVMAVLDGKVGGIYTDPDTLFVNLEPCDACQEYLATQTSIKRVGFGLTRQDAVDLKLVKSHDETIFDRVKKFGYPYEVVHIDSPQLRRAGRAVLDCVSRDLNTGEVRVDANRLSDVWQKLDLAA